ncbi:connexin 27.5 [Plakobranchus ocellatus]|uniref:Connexin 27.5 n=1 Tax=Plakobranchus ocellatus TaxID=259542 RepID=A0AAV3YKR3_9GAST|nr:connexin 27.5 [Plakobranchus ocellatus]
MAAAKRAKTDCKFRQEYTQTWTFIVSSKIGDTHARCTVCDADFSVKSGGKYDVERHIKGKKHQDKATATATSMPVFSFFKQSTAHEDAVTKAELGLAAFFTEHNLPLSAMDHLTGLLKNIFPDSKIAQGIKCGRSKATELVKTVAAERTEKLVKKMKSQPFSISTDGSNDSGAGQLYPIVIKTFDDVCGQVLTQLLCLATCNGASTG